MLNTKRLNLRLINNEDAAFLYELMNSPTWHQMIGDRGVYSVEDALQYMQERMHPDLNEKGFVNHLMIEKETGIAVGTCSLHDRPGVAGIDIGYAILQEHEGKGYATEGAQAMVDLAFDQHQFKSVSAITTDENKGSCRVLEKLNFKHTSYIQLPGSTEKIRLYELFKKSHQ